MADTKLKRAHLRTISSQQVKTLASKRVYVGFLLCALLTTTPAMAGDGIQGVSAVGGQHIRGLGSSPVHPFLSDLNSSSDKRSPNNDPILQELREIEARGRTPHASPLRPKKEGLISSPDTSSPKGITVEKKLGEGGTAVVYQVRDENGNVYAIKIAKPTAEGATPRSLEDTHRVLSNADSKFLPVPDVVTISLDGGKTVAEALKTEIVTPLTRVGDMSLTGTNGWQELSKQEKIDRINFLSSLKDSLVGLLTDLDANGLVHRDIKPGNLGVGDDGSIVIFDNDTVSKGQRSKTFGTPAYISPEVLSGDDSQSRASDIWAAGATVLDMMTGRTPYDTDSGFDGFGKGSHVPTTHGKSLANIKDMISEDSNFTHGHNRLARELGEFQSLAENDPELPAEQREKLKEITDFVITSLDPDPDARSQIIPNTQP